MKKNMDLENRRAREASGAYSDGARRRALLNSTRKQMGRNRPEYGSDSKYDHFGIPAVHPRYRASYRSIYPNGYGEDETPAPPSTLYRRVIIALCLFFAFLLCDYQQISWNGIDASVVQERVSSSESFEAVSRMVQDIKDGL